MSKDKRQSNKKNTPKQNTSKKVTDTKLTKATKKEKLETEKNQKAKIKNLEPIEEDIYEFDEDLDFEEEEQEIEETIEEEIVEELDSDEIVDKDIEEENNDDEELDEEDTEELEEDNDDIEELDEEESNDEDIDEDFEDDSEEEVEEIEEVVETKTTTKKEKKIEEKIQKIEKIAKEKKRKTKAKSETLMNFIAFFEKYRYPIYSFIGGILLTTLIVFFIWPDRIATLKNGEEPIVKVGKENYTADELYKVMKDYFSVSLLLDEIDNDLLTKIYPEDKEMTDDVNDDAEYYLNMYKEYYGYTEEEFLKKNGFSSYNAFLDYLRLDHRRNKYLDDYVEKNISDDEIKKYYEENVFGDINTQHVLVEVSTSDTDGKLKSDEAKKLAEEIITKLNDGTSWETIQKDYKDKITYEDLGYQSWDASLEESFMDALKEMEDNTYSEEPVKTSYGYHVIYRIEQKKTPTLKKVKSTIIENIVTDKKAEDSNLLYKALIALRNEKKIDFKDTDMKSKYDDYCKQYK